VLNLYKNKHKFYKHLFLCPYGNYNNNVSDKNNLKIPKKFIFARFYVLYNPNCFYKVNFHYYKVNSHRLNFKS
jgi:hypothetical protein